MTLKGETFLTRVNNYLGGGIMNIEEVCRDGVAKYYAAVFSNNAAIPVVTGVGTGEPRIITPRGQLLFYNLYRVDEYLAMVEDSFLPEGFKAELGKHRPALKGIATCPDLNGWHVLRTPAPLAGEQLGKTLTAIQGALDTPHYNLTLRSVGTVRDYLIREEVYGISAQLF